MILFADNECLFNESGYADAQDDLGLRCPHMSEDTILHGTTHISLYLVSV